MLDKVKTLAVTYKKQLIVAGVIAVSAVTTLVVMSQIEKNGEEVVEDTDALAELVEMEVTA